jgi:hypothetical protein
MTYTAPSDALTWGSAGERNKRLMRWRRAVSMTFAEQPRCLRVAWALDHLFNAKTGYAYPLNKQLANMTGLPINKIQEALLTLESDGAIVRRSIVLPNGQPQRVIYAATALLPSVEGVGPPLSVGVGGQPPWGGVGGHPRQVGAHNLKTPRMPKTELARARLAAELRQEREASERGKVVGCPSSEATGDGKGTRLTEKAAVSMSRCATGQLTVNNDDGLGAAELPWLTPTLTEQPAPDDGTPAFLRRKTKGARDRTPDAGKMASDQETTEEEGTWRL